MAQAVVTVQKHYQMATTYRQESITLLRDPQPVWCEVLPRRDLHDRFIVVERRFKNNTKKYIYANPDNIRIWLNYLFKNHKDYVRKKKLGLLELSEAALDALNNQSELAKVIYTGDKLPRMDLTDNDSVENTQLPSADVDAGLSKNDAYVFDRNPNMYMKNDQVLKLRNRGMIEIIKDEAERKYCYDPKISANISFPDLYPNGEPTPTDCGSHSISRKLLKKQAQFAKKLSNGLLKWIYAEEGVHMMHQYARVIEMNIRALVGWYVSQKPERANIPIDSLLNAFKEGVNDEGMIDSQFPDLHGLMAQIRNSKENWYAERLGIETMSRDLGDPNLFFTINMEPRNWPDVRQLIYKLEHGSLDGYNPDYYERNNEIYTNLLDKYAVQLSTYLHFKVKMFNRAFFQDICGIENIEEIPDSTNPGDRTKTSWSWSRAEFTQTRGVQHWHCLAKLPNVLDTAILGRMVQNMRIVREEMKCQNIKPDKIVAAWEMIEMGLLATRYLCLLGESISKASFFTTSMGLDEYDETKVIDLKKLKKMFRENHTSRKMDRKTNACMRSFMDEDCTNCNINIEEAEVAAMCCIHGCMPLACGGDPDRKNRKCKCRYDFPKKNRKFTVPAIMNINNEQVEVHLLLKRTDGDIPHLNRYFLQYLRANHDVTVLVDAAHQMRYAAKYVSKSTKIDLLLSEIIEFLETRCGSLIPPTVKQTLTHLLLADCSHKAYMSKHELAYNVLDLPKVRKTFHDVKVVGCYPRSTIIEKSTKTETGLIEYSDRTTYSAYGERMKSTTIVHPAVRKSFGDLSKVNLRTFAENINHKWVLNTKGNQTPATNNGTDDNNNQSEYELPHGRKFRSRDIDSGYWILRLKKKPCHIRWSTVLYTRPVTEYQPIDPENTTSQQRFFDVEVSSRRLLQRAYQEMVCYLPWENNPDSTFLGQTITDDLNNDETDPDKDARYSLQRLQKYHEVYMKEWLKGTVAKPGKVLICYGINRNRKIIYYEMHHEYLIS
jgi:hypothetical protein